MAAFPLDGVSLTPVTKKQRKYPLRKPKETSTVNKLMLFSRLIASPPTQEKLNIKGQT